MPEFQPWPKIARLNRDIVITEKIDGTNAAIGITDDDIYAQSRTRILDPNVKGGDNFGFARWVFDHQSALRNYLGIGLHFGEWWGQGIQRGYGLDHKRFSLFNVRRFREQGLLFESGVIPGLGVVPVLYEGPVTYEDDPVPPWLYRLDDLRQFGSKAAPGFMKPEGIVIFHTAASTMFKVTLEGDEAPKGAPRS